MKTYSTISITVPEKFRINKTDISICTTVLIFPHQLAAITTPASDATKRKPLMIKSRLIIMIEGRLPEEGVYIARTYMDAPDIDGYVFVESEWNLISGDFITVEIIGADEYDLIGKVVEDDSEGVEA